MKKLRYILLVLTCFSGLSSLQAQTNIPSTTVLGVTPSQVSMPGTYTDPSGAPKSTFNYTRIWVPTIPSTSALGFTLSLTDEYRIATTYTNGWGTPVEQIIRGKILGKDIVVPANLRPSLTSVSLLPYTAPLNSRFQSSPFQDQKNYYISQFPSDSGVSYGLTKQTSAAGLTTVKSMAPGKYFAGNNKGTSTTTAFKDSNFTVYKFSIGTTYSLGVGTYANGQLSVRSTTSADGVQVREFYNKDDQIVCKMVFDGTNWLSTYYAYDNLGRLAYIIPPKAVALSIPNASWNQPENLSYCYIFRYNKYDQVISKKVPGKFVDEEIVYDRKHRPVLVRTNLLEDQNKYAFTIYDRAGRTVMTGILNNSTYNLSPAGWQAFIDTATLTVAGTIKDYLVNGFTTNYQLNKAYPDTVSACEILSYNYYDSYAATADQPARPFDATLYADYLIGDPYVPPAAYNFNYGQLTASRVKVMDNGTTGANTWISSVYYYDRKGRLQEALTINPWNLGAWDINLCQYNFTGQKVLDILKHYGPFGVNKSQTKIVNKYNYDPYDGKLTSVQQKLDGGLWTTLSSYVYDDLGAVKTKWLGSVEQQDYSYNIRGQLTGINKDDLWTAGGSFPATVSYAQSLFYETGFSTRKYDGTLTGFQWHTRSTEVSAYGYVYDDAGRLIKADYRDYSANSANGGTVEWNKTSRDFSLSNVTYDENGNLLTLRHKGPNGNGAPALIDNLTYTYGWANQLLKVTEAGLNSPNIDDFTNGTSGTNDDYTYDHDGNLKSDLNKGITNIGYNYQDLPLKVNKGNDSIVNIYDASGTLLQKTITTAGVAVKYRYWGPFVYKDTGLEYMLHDEGRARWLADSSFFKYEYFVKDHLGNVRTVIASDLAPLSTSYLATHEIASVNIEDIIFDNIEAVRDIKPLGTPQDNQSALLDGGNPSRRIGTAMVLRVMAGDKINLKAYSYHHGKEEEDVYTPAESMLNALISTLSGGAGGYEGGEDGNGTEYIYNLFTAKNYVQAYDLIQESATDPLAPRAYLNYIVFDNDFNIVAGQSGAIQVSGNANSWQPVELPSDLVVDKNGYIAVYISNPQSQSVWFDNLSITHASGRLVEEQHYYPHGLVMMHNQAAATTTPNKFHYQGKLMQDELGMQLYDFQARQYDPQLGRFWGLDPADEFASGYTGMGNDPANLTDPSGMWTNGQRPADPPKTDQGGGRDYVDPMEECHMPFMVARGSGDATHRAVIAYFDAEYISAHGKEGITAFQKAWNRLVKIEDEKRKNSNNVSQNFSFNNAGKNSGKVSATYLGYVSKATIDNTVYNLDALREWADKNGNITPVHYNSGDGCVSLEEASGWTVNGQPWTPYSEASTKLWVSPLTLIPEFAPVGATTNFGDLTLTGNFSGSPMAHLHPWIGDAVYNDPNSLTGKLSLTSYPGPSQNDRDAGSDQFFNAVIDPISIYLFKGETTYRIDRYKK